MERFTYFLWTLRPAEALVLEIWIELHKRARKNLLDRKTLSLLRFREKPLDLVDDCLILDSLEHCLKLFSGFCTLSRLIVAL